MDGRSLGSTYKISIENLKSNHSRSFIYRRGTSYICLWNRIHIKQSTHHSSSDDINDYEALTPNHILLGHSSSNHAPGVFRDDEINYRKKWRAVQAATNMFWSRWLKEYLPMLVQRRKWNYPTQNLNVGDLVVIQTDNIPRSHWSLGRILERYPGVDGVLRTVKVKRPNNELFRPAQKLCLLEKANK